jgi:chemotaxis methyl-accepting protein methylase
MLWEEDVAPGHPGLPLRILALDLDPASLARARAAVYHPATLRELPRGWRERWFQETRRGLEFQRERLHSASVGFVRARLEALPVRPGSADLLLCRYLAFTYYRGGRLDRARQQLERTLRPGGVLVTGAKEAGPPVSRTHF